MNRNILLIGGSHGVGNAITAHLYEDHTVFVACREKGDLPDSVTHIPFDVINDSLDLNFLPDSLHGFIYCPGSINLKPFKMLTEKDFETDFQINFLSLVRTLKQVLPLLTKIKGSSIVLFSTVAVQMGMPFHSSVAASKGAIEGFAKALAAEYAPTLRINVIAPSLTDTPLAENLLSSDSKREKMASRHPLKRIGTPEDIANIAVFLLSDKSSWITGQTLGVDGGLSTINLN